MKETNLYNFLIKNKSTIRVLFDTNLLDQSLAEHIEIYKYYLEAKDYYTDISPVDATAAYFSISRATTYRIIRRMRERINV